MAWVLTHGNILASVDPIERELPKYRRSERLFHPVRFLEMLPLSHVFGQFMGMFIPTLIGGTVHFQDSFKPTDIVAIIKRERISVLVAVPRVVESLKNKMRDDLGALIEKNWDRGEEHFQTLVALPAKARFGWKFWAIISGGANSTRTRRVLAAAGYVVVKATAHGDQFVISLNHPFMAEIDRQSLPGRDET